LTFYEFIDFGKYGDFSYGVSIRHFTIIQFLLHTGWFQKKPWLFMIAGTVITSVWAIAVRHLVEKKFPVTGPPACAVSFAAGKILPKSRGGHGH